MSVPAQLERYFCIWAGLGGDERTLGKAHPWTTCKNCTRQVADDFISSRMSTVPKQSLTIMVKMKTLHRKSLRRKMCTLSRRVWLFVTPCTVACQAPLSMGFPRQESWSGLPFPLPGNLPDLKIRAGSPASPALAGTFFITKLPGKHQEEK